MSLFGFLMDILSDPKPVTYPYPATHKAEDTACVLKPASVSLMKAVEAERQAEVSMSNLYKKMHLKLEKDIICGIQSSSERGNTVCGFSIPERVLDLFDKSELKRRLIANGYKIIGENNPYSYSLTVEGLSVYYDNFISISWGEK